MNDMKAWCVEDINEEHATIVFAKTRNKAKYLATQYDKGLQDYRYNEVRATRVPQADKYAGDKPYVLDFDIGKDRLIMVRDADFYCFEPEYDDCEKCVAKDYCEVYEGYLESRKDEPDETDRRRRYERYQR